MLTKKRNICIVIFALLFTGCLYAQNDLNFEFDYAQFKYDSTSNLVEIYIFIDKSSLELESDTKNVGLALNININDTLNNNVIMDKTYELEDVYDKTAADSRAIVSTLKFAVPFGEYVLKISVKDKNKENNHKIIEDFLYVAGFNAAEFHVSGIQLANNIISGSENETSMFYKNGLEVIPNPTSYYNQKPVMFYYAELYFNDVEGDKFALEKTILDNYGRIVNHKTRKINSTQNDLVEVDVVNLTKLSTGSYTLVLTLIDSTANTYNQSIRKFYLLNPLDSMEVAKTETSGYLSSEFAAMSEEECDLEFAALRYLVSDGQKDSYEKLKTLESKRKYLYEFWKVRDYDLTTPVNERRLEYMQRVEHARERFRTFNKDGVKTDRGRVYLIYGEPDDIEYHHSTLETKPYEIWYYNSIEGGVHFVFGDLSGYNDYQLLHSTKRGEVIDENWFRRLNEAY